MAPASDQAVPSKVYASAELPTLVDAIQKVAVGHDTAAVHTMGAIFCGLDHVVPSKVRYFPTRSTAMQKVLVAQDTPRNPRPSGSIETGRLQCGTADPAATAVAGTASTTQDSIDSTRAPRLSRSIIMNPRAIMLRADDLSRVKLSPRRTIRRPRR